MNTLNIDRKSILSDLTQLIHLARTGNKAEASTLAISLDQILAHLPVSDWVAQQQKMLANILSQYQVTPPQRLSSHAVSTTNVPIDDYVKEVKPGVSLVTCCMNRSENLLKALPSWVRCPEINQIIIVDWGSKESVRDEITAAGIDDPRILVARVNDQPRWILSYAFNFGFRISAYDKILKTDADIIIKSEFFQENELRPGAFLSGDWRTAEKGQEHINGFFFVRRSDLLAIKGFNEYITTYGWDDDDIYFRLEQHGSNRVRIKTGGVYHIPHGDAQRVGEGQQPANALEELRLDTGAKIMGNRFLAGAMPMWNSDRIFAPFVVTRTGAGYLEAEQHGESYHQVPTHIRSDVDYYGLVAALSWTTELTAYSIPKDRLYKLLSARQRRGDITRADVRLAACSNQDKIDWHHHLLILTFENDIPTEEQCRVVNILLGQARKHHFTILVEPALFKSLSINQTDEVRNILPTPSGFHTHQLPERDAEDLKNPIQAFVDTPIIVVKLMGQDTKQLFPLAQINTKKRRDRLYVHVQHGLGNRLRALASATTIAQATNRTLVVIWTPDHHCECHLRDLFEYDGLVEENEDCVDSALTDRYTYMELEPGACKDAPIAPDEGRDLYVRTAYVINNKHSNWETENAVLRSLKPMKAVMDMLNNVDVTGRIGVHVRMEGAAGMDKQTYDSAGNWLPESHEQLNYWRGQSHYNKFMNRIDALIDSAPEKRFFLAADLPQTYQYFNERYGDRFSMLSRNVFDRSAHQLKFAIADALLLSRCNHLLGSTWSSFTELALRFSTTVKTVEMSGKDF